MRVLVTGASGLLGQKLVALLATDATIDLFTTARKQPTFAQAGTFIAADITDRQAVLALMNATSPNLVIHTAAMTQVDQCEQERDACWRTNVDAVSYFCEACHHHGSRMMYISTDFVFDGSHGPLTESDQPNPVNYYGESKLAAERIVQASGLPWCIVRTVLVYGITHDMSRSNIIVWVKKNLEEGKSIQVVTDQWRTPTLAEDLAQGCYLAATGHASGIYHISGNDFMTPFDMAIASANFFKLDVGLIKPTNAAMFTQPGKRPAKTGFVIDKARTDLGYAPHSFAEGLAIVAAQLRS